MQFIVLSSSNGTTFQAVIDALKNGSLTARCLGLLTDRGDRGCVDKANAAGIPVQVVERKAGETSDGYDQRLLAAARVLEERGDAAQTVIAAMGWMHLLTPTFLCAFPGRVLNVHPALLPRHGGKGMYGMHVHRSVIADADADSGITIHVMNERYDEGKILLQKMFPVLPHDTPETLKTKAQELEKLYYPQLLQSIERGEVIL